MDLVEVMTRGNALSDQLATGDPSYLREVHLDNLERRIVGHKVLEEVLYGIVEHLVRRYVNALEARKFTEHITDQCFHEVVAE